MPMNTTQTLAGGAKHLLDLPLDMVLEIFSYLHPLDLLTLLRTLKTIYSFLLRKSSNQTWKYTFRNVKLPLPDIPEDAMVNNLIFSFIKLRHLLSKSELSEGVKEQVRDAYNLFNDDFEETVQAFDQYRIDIRYIFSNPIELLERYLVENTSATDIQLYRQELEVILSTVLDEVQRKLRLYHLVHREIRDWQWF
ncbi:hypothetical protein CPB83DRAFT_838403 [Crepidotus variabilis]|uniref:F-box domain-containing protein n=1 Tax=Crepidotus variabilis TaxID=179855 RepID=A0A9P6JM00_9AGAR|nr:hypothetical protein CPB83DRAFT_838403 [Crepidotus variabilis]